MSQRRKPTKPTQNQTAKKIYKAKLEVSVTKQAINVIDTTQKLILLEWKPNGGHFLTNAIFHGKQHNVKVHLFFNKKDKDEINTTKLKQAFNQSLVFHESLTTAEDAAWIDLLAFVINFYTKTLISCHHCAVTHPNINYQVTLVTSKQGRYDELKALLKSNSTETRLVNGWQQTIVDLFTNVCHQCNIVFTTKPQADKHDHEQHNFLCDSKSCERSKRENGFFTTDELQQHKKLQQQCQFCSVATFCDITKYNDHMEKFHVFCNCSCDKYYSNTEDYIEHYCTMYPLPCLEVPECESRFKNIDDQAFHHKTIHGCTNPYFCIACYSNSKLICLKTSDELMNHVSMVKHTQEDFNVVIIPETPTPNKQEDSENDEN